ncbi:hypothetical protein ES703_78128 [subsurface metagenome]
MQEPILVFSVSEARKKLKLSRAKMYEMVNSGQIFSVRAGRRILIPYKSLEKFLEPAQKEKND